MTRTFLHMNMNLVRFNRQKQWRTIHELLSVMLVPCITLTGRSQQNLFVIDTHVCVEYLRVNGSVRHNSKTAGAAFPIPTLDIELTGRVTIATSSAIAERLAIQAALQRLAPLQNAGPVVIVSDTASALRRMDHP